MIDKREQRGILQDWVTQLGLRHQGVLLTAIRGCDTAPKEDVSKDLSRAIRGLILLTHCADPKQSSSFIEDCDSTELETRYNAFMRNCDQYPHHFVMHIVHATQVIGYCHASPVFRGVCELAYARFCSRLHVRPETEAAMNERLNQDEITFRQTQ